MSNVLPFPRMTDGASPRNGPDRRSSPRGGRRATDKAGHAPLVLLVDHDEHTNARCEAILAKLHFAVAPTRTIEEARRVMQSLHPNVIVATVAEAAALRQANASNLPVVILNDVMDPEMLVEEIRRELRAHPPHA